MGGFKKPVNFEEVIDAKKEQVESLVNKCLTVEKMIAVNSDQQYRIRVEKDDLERQAAQKVLEIEDMEQLLDQQVKFMTNLSKNSEEHLKSRLAAVQKTFDDFTKENADLQKKLDTLNTRKEADLLRWEKDVEDKEKQIEEKALIFGLRLRDTLIKIDIQ